MIHLKEPYWSAGKKYGWPGKSVGLGLKRSEFIGDGKIEVTVGDDPQVWEIEKEKARELVNKYRSATYIKDALICIVPWHEFEKRKSKEEEEAEKNKPKQTNLF